MAHYILRLVSLLLQCPRGILFVCVRISLFFLSRGRVVRGEIPGRVTRPLDPRADVPSSPWRGFLFLFVFLLVFAFAYFSISLISFSFVCLFFLLHYVCSVRTHRVLVFY